MSLKFEFTADEVINQGRVTRKFIDDIKTWMNNENFPQATDEQIVLFLLSCENVIEQTKITILAFYKVKYMGPKIFNDRFFNTKEMQQQISVVESCVIPRRTKDNYMVLFQRFKNTSHWNFQLESSMKYLFSTVDMGLQKNPPDGLIGLFDMKGMSLMHLTKLRVGPLKLFFKFLQEAMPCKIKSIHVLNSAYFVDKLIAIIKPFLKKELYEMLNFHQSNIDMDYFFENCVEAECVPSDYGGKSPSVHMLEELSIEKLKNMDEWFRIEEEIRKDYKPPK